MLEELTRRINDGTHQPPPFVASGVPFLLVSNIAKGRIDWIAEKYISLEVFEQLSKTWRPQKGDVLYSLVGSYGVPAMVDRETPFTFQRHIGLIRPDPGRLLPKFLYWYLTSPSGVQQAHLRAEGLAQKTITLGALRSFRVPAPTLERQSQIVLEIDTVQEAINSLENRVCESKGAANALVAGGFEGSY
jgi:restriction endonuclease S subunit